ncbi:MULTISPECIES: hypothetical protein [Actinomadura]|uniref:Uncharacterized protein n=1 Tax=Actinomadura litoris TaxID=2678616 RepID=A0A7K1L224_9ACTN|nr:MULTISPECIES: hypothetical protein [Actinomadura]MBT2206586.1 hypothetical protein [Actinomadura sp. NEAU-AAG7]MUN38315.1 hypothetical protein [Actinomadura litoris]
MDSRIGAVARGPAGWLLTFLGARERGLRTHRGLAAGPAEWLLAFLEVERAELDVRRPPAKGRQRPAMLAPRGRAEESPFARRPARSA